MQGDPASARWRRRIKNVIQALQTPIRPIQDIPCPAVDLAHADDPVAAIIAAPEFAETTRWFHSTLGRSLTSTKSQALLFALTHNLKLAVAFEIGTYRAGGSEAICRALQANGHGMLYTTDPFGRSTVPPILFKWPRALRKHVEFLPRDSMSFFALMEAANIASSLTFIDGRHDYHFALFDLHAAARTIAPGGFIVLDNICQPGPYLALRDFLQSKPGWIECGKSIGAYAGSDPLDKCRVCIPDTDFAVLRAPSGFFIGRRAETFGERPVVRQRVDGVTLSVAGLPSRGKLLVQCVLRGFGTKTPEVHGTALADVERVGDLTVRFSPPIAIDGAFERMTAEVWLVWSETAPLRLARPPTVI